MAQTETTLGQTIPPPALLFMWKRLLRLICQLDSMSKPTNKDTK
jgi:hypothetical protein